MNDQPSALEEGWWDAVWPMIRASKRDVYTNAFVWKACQAAVLHDRDLRNQREPGQRLLREQVSGD